MRFILVLIYFLINPCLFGQNELFQPQTLDEWKRYTPIKVVASADAILPVKIQKKVKHENLLRQNRDQIFKYVSRLAWIRGYYLTKKTKVELNYDTNNKELSWFFKIEIMDGVKYGERASLEIAFDQLRMIEVKHIAILISTLRKPVNLIEVNRN